jgi:lysophospholipase L1-like esterase
MNRQSNQALWYASLPLLPTLAMQGAYVAVRAQRLPEASGLRHGVVGAGEARASLCVVGESTAAGVGVAQQEDGLTVKLARCLAARWGCAIRWQVAGRNGATMADVHREMLPALEAPLGIVVVLSGVNDTVKLTSRRRFARDAQSVYDTARARGARRVVFSAVPPMSEFPLLPQPLRSVLGLRAALLDRQLREQLAPLPHASHAPLGPIAAAQNMASDGFHPNADGYELWASVLAEHVALVAYLPAQPEGERGGLSP